MSKILIIGSKGFIGKHCADFFKKQPNIDVYSSDVVVDYVDKNYHLIDAFNSNYSEVFQSNKFDVCINCSGAASVPNSIQHPGRDYQLNTINVFKMLDAIRQFNPECKFINFSSAAVYGNPSSLPIAETHSIAPLSPYGYHKWQSEILCKEMSEQFGLKTVSLRIFSAYGGGLYKQLFWDLYQKSKIGNKIELFGTGEESRDFINVQDIVQILNLVIKNLEFTGNVLNVANGIEVFIKNAVATFYKLLNIDTEYSFRGSVRKGDPSNWVADISLLQAIGYQPQITLEEGLEKYVEWLRELK